MSRVQKAQAAKRRRRAAKEGTPKAMRDIARAIGMQVTPSAKERREQLAEEAAAFSDYVAAKMAGELG